MKGGKYYGTKAMMNVWKPRIQFPEFEMSLAQFWIGAGSFGVDLNSLEAGWQVFLYCNLAHYLTGFFSHMFLQIKQALFCEVCTQIQQQIPHPTC